MFTEIVRFLLPPAATRESVLATFATTAPVWGENPDLVRKYYLFDAETRTAGGVYLWRERAHAARWHGPEFRAKVKALYGAEPTFELFETPLVVESAADPSAATAVRAG